MLNLLTAIAALATDARALEPVDLDGDGYTVADDCDDADPAVHPDADELCNGVDDDCDSSSGEDHVVSVGGQAYPTIQQAIAGAESGATVAIRAGTWSENLSVGRKTIALEGVGADQTILDGGFAGSVITASNRGELTVRNLSVQHGSTTGGGGGINASGALVLVVEDSVVSENHANLNGGGIDGPSLGTARISRTVVNDNDAGSGGGAHLPGQRSLTSTIEQCEFRGNVARSNGGGLATPSSKYRGGTHISDTVFDGNESEGGGGGLYTGVDTLLERVTVSNNEALNGGGVMAVGRNSVAADPETEIFGNSTAAGGAGGGVYHATGQQHNGWSGGHVHDNTAEYGGGLYLSHSWYNGHLFGTLVENNHAWTAGGGVYMTSATERVLHVQILDNTSDDVAGGLYIRDWASTGTPRFTDSVVSGNVAANLGGGVMTEDDMSSVHSAWGTGSTDNIPDDVVLYDLGSGDVVVFDGFGPAAGFVCRVSAGTCR